MQEMLMAFKVLVLVLYDGELPNGFEVTFIKASG